DAALDRIHFAALHAFHASRSPLQIETCGFSPILSNRKTPSPIFMPGHSKLTAHCCVAHVPSFCLTTWACGRQLFSSRSVIGFTAGRTARTRAARSWIAARASRSRIAFSARQLARHSAEQ